MGPKDTPFEGGVFAAKFTFVSSRLLFDQDESDDPNIHIAPRLSIIAFQDEI